MTQTLHWTRRGFLSSSLASASLISLNVACSQTTDRNDMDTRTGPDINNAAANGEVSLPDLQPPVAKRVEHSLTQLERTRIDPYHWMKDDNWQDVMRDPSVLDAEIRAYLDAENAYKDAMLKTPNQPLIDQLVAEMRGRIKEDDSSVPLIDGPYAYGSRYLKGAEYPIYTRIPAGQAFAQDTQETIIFDGPKEAEGKDYFDIGAISHSPDHKYLAVSVDDKGSEYNTLHVREIETGRDLGIALENTTGDIIWTADSSSFYWGFRNEKGRPERIYRYSLASGESTLIYTEPDEGFFLGIGKSQSGEFIFIRSNDHTTSEYRWIRAEETEETDLTLIAARQVGHEYDVTHYKGEFYIRTNLDGAVDFKIMRAPITAQNQSEWQDYLPHQPGRLILDMHSLQNYLLWVQRDNGLPQCIIEEGETGERRPIIFDEAAYSLSLIKGYGYDTPWMRYRYSSPTTPDQIYDYNLATDERILRKTREVPSGHDASAYVTERIFAPAEDGETIPITILRLKSTPVDGTAPLLLYGYGSYGVTIPARFATSRLSLVDRGFIYAIAHIRGSTAKGYQWYLDGKLEKKINTFTDYIAAAQHLIDQNYTSKGDIVALGGSAGGLLMGAAANLAPDLFAGIIAAVPFVDVLNTMSDADLPLTPPEWPEWGNPLTDAEAYDLILSWSPYDQVGLKPYPPMLITGGLTDPRVTYWEPTKWIAKLRYEAPEAGPYYLHMNMGAGHGGASGRFEGLKETALEYAFALNVVGKGTAPDG